MDIQNLIKSDLLILIPVLYLIGIGLKKSKLPNKWIPISLGIIAIILSTMWVLATTELSGKREVYYAIFTAVTQGVLAAGGSVYANQIYIQARKKE